MESITITYTLLYPEFREATSKAAQRAKSSGMSIFMVGISAVLMVISFWVNSFGSFWGAMGIFVVLCLGIFAVLFLIKHFLMRLIWNSRSDLQATNSLTLEDSFLVREFNGNKSAISWKNVKGWFETRRTIVISTTLGTVIVPKREILDTTLQGIRGFVDRKISEHNKTVAEDKSVAGAFPVLVSKD